jgi:hypothetical protein
MQKQHLDARVVTDAFGPDVEPAARRLYRYHLHSATKNVIAAGIIEVA